MERGLLPRRGCPSSGGTQGEQVHARHAWGHGPTVPPGDLRPCQGCSWRGRRARRISGGGWLRHSRGRPRRSGRMGRPRSLRPRGSRCGRPGWRRNVKSGRNWGRGNRYRVSRWGGCGRGMRHGQEPSVDPSSHAPCSSPTSPRRLGHRDAVAAGPLRPRSRPSPSMCCPRGGGRSST